MLSAAMVVSASTTNTEILTIKSPEHASMKLCKENKIIVINSVSVPTVNILCYI